MGLLSKLFGDAVEKAANNAIKNVANEVKKNQNGSGSSASSAPSSSSASYSAPVEKTGPSGFSWGPVMPAEENQFNYNGSHVEYFEKIFTGEFPEYSIDKKQEGATTVFTFTSGGRKALVVELLKSTSGRYKNRKECEAAGIPYLRYYYDHEGWWNTKAYVIERTRKALG